MQMFLRGKPTTSYTTTETGLIALRELLGNHLVIPRVIEMSLSSAFLAGCDTGRQQVKDSWEHLHLDDTIPPAGVWWHWRKSPCPVTSCCRENFIRLLVRGIAVEFSRIHPVGRSCGWSCYPWPQSWRPKALWLCRWRAVTSMRAPDPVPGLQWMRLTLDKSSFSSLKMDTGKLQRDPSSGWAVHTFYTSRKDFLMMSLFLYGFQGAWWPCKESTELQVLTPSPSSKQVESMIKHGGGGMNALSVSNLLWH